MLGYHEGLQVGAVPITGIIPAKLKGSSLNRKVATSVRVIETLDEPLTLVRYHDTDIVRFNTESITLDTGGWFTPTTKRRMNQASSEYGLGFSVVQEQGVWRVYYGLGTVLRFIDGKVTFPR